MINYPKDSTYDEDEKENEYGVKMRPLSAKYSDQNSQNRRNDHFYFGDKQRESRKHQYIIDQLQNGGDETPKSAKTYHAKYNHEMSMSSGDSPYRPVIQFGTSNRQGSAICIKHTL